MVTVLGASMYQLPGRLGTVCCILAVLGGCTSTEYVAPKKFYIIDKSEENEYTNAYRLHELSKGRVDKQEWGEFHFSGKDPEEEAVAVKIRKEKEFDGPSRYKAQSHIPSLDMESLGGKTDFLFTYDKNRRFWMGFELKFRKNLWTPEPEFGRE